MNKNLDRVALYKKILKQIKQKPAIKSPLSSAYFTTDNLRALHDYIFSTKEKKCQSRKIR